MSKKQQAPNNFLDYVVRRADGVAWHEEPAEAEPTQVSSDAAAQTEGSAQSERAEAAAQVAEGEPGATGELGTVDAEKSASNAQANGAQAANMLVVLDIENTGAFNKLAQKLFGKPRVSHVHLDEFGSFVWKRIDGQRTVAQLAELVHEHFGEAAEPLHPRIAKYLQIVESYHFIELIAPGQNTNQ